MIAFRAATIKIWTGTQEAENTLQVAQEHKLESTELTVLRCSPDLIRLSPTVQNGTNRQLKSLTLS
jgi:hypothetical protein